VWNLSRRFLPHFRCNEDQLTLIRGDRRIQGLVPDAEFRP